MIEVATLETQIQTEAHFPLTVKLIVALVVGMLADRVDHQLRVEGECMKVELALH